MQKSIVLKIGKLLIYYKGVLCNLATYRVMGEDRPALYPVDFSEEEIFYREFNEVHYGLWAKILSDEEYQEIVDVIMGLPSRGKD